MRSRRNTKKNTVTAVQRPAVPHRRSTPAAAPAAPRTQSAWAPLLGALIAAALVGGVVRWFTSSNEQATAAGLVASGVAIQVFRDGYQEAARIANEAGNFVVNHSNAIVLA